MTNIQGTYGRCGPAVRAITRWVKGVTALESCAPHCHELAPALRGIGFAAGGQHRRLGLRGPAEAPR